MRNKAVGKTLEYFINIWEAKFFWGHLTLSDLRSRWRRSFFGIFWSILQPLGITLLISFVYSKLLKTDIGTYAPYILSGLIVWDFISFNIIGGSVAFVQADAYIKQYKHPLAIYTLRNVFGGLIILGFSSIVLFTWTIVVMPENLGIHWLATLSIFPVLTIIVWPIATISAYLGVRFRDFSHASALILQAIWFVSPVYFETRMFQEGGLDYLINMNPIYHILQILRAPLLQGSWPTATNYAFSLLTGILAAILAWFIGYRFEKRVIFYL